MLSGRVFAAQDLNVYYSNDDVYDSGAIPLEVEIRLYDENYNELPDTFSVVNEGFNLKENEKITSLRSGDKVKVGNDKNNPLIIHDVPENTNYRIVVFQMPYVDVKIEKTTITGNVSENPNPTISGRVITKRPSTVIPFNSLLKEGTSINHPQFTYSLTPKEEYSYVDYPKDPITVDGVGLYGIPIIFSKVGTYNFYLKQTAVAPGLKLDETVYEIELTYGVEDDFLESFFVDVKVNGNPLETPPSFENESQAITFKPEVKKILNGTEISAKNFNYTLSAGDGNKESYSLPENCNLTTQGNKEGNFDPITFSDEGTYHFNITEQAGNDPGYSYDSAQWDLTVEVGKDESGALKINRSEYQQTTSLESGEEAVFTNNYNSGSLVIKKVVSGKDDESRDFNFKLTLNDSEGKPLTLSYPATGAGKDTLTNEDTFTLKKDGTVTISGLPEGAKYKVEELNLPNGYTSQIDKAEGEIIKDDSVTATCTNTYNPTPTTFKAKVKKNLTGSPGVSTSFNFTLENKDEDQGVALPEKITVQPGNEGEFNDLTFTKAGEYHFLIKEENTGQTGFTYDETPVELTVNVVDHDGNLSIDSSTYTKDKDSDQEMAIFNNTYNPLPTSFTPKVIKTIEGEPAADYQDFNFTLTKQEESDEGDDVTDARSAHIGANEKEKEFDPINFTKTGTFKYLIKETPGSYSYTYDESEIVLEVVVSDNNGQLQASATYKKGEEPLESQDGAVFTNKFNSGTLTIQKEVQGTTTEQAFTFRISLTEGEAPTKVNFPTEGIESVETVTDQSTFTLKNGESIKIKNLPVGMNYSVTEESLPHGYTNKFEGESSGKITGESEVILKCINTYMPDPTDYSPKITKELTGLSPTTQEAFNFSLTKAGEKPSGDNVGDGITGTVNGAGDVTMDAIHFTQAGVFNYTITETTGESQGYTYDNSQWNLQVTVIDTDGVLSVSEAKYSKDGVEEAEKATFSNNYKPQAAVITPKVKKVISGEKIGSPVFNFTLTESQEAAGKYEVSEPKTTSVTGEGEGSFGVITFNEPGTYTFEIKEEAGNEPGYVYDSSTWELKVEVIDNGGILQATPTYSVKTEAVYLEESLENTPLNILSNLLGSKVKAAEMDGTETLINEAAFNNSYESGKLKISKTVTGETSENTEFLFHLRLLNSSGESQGGSYPTSKGEAITDNSDFKLKDGENVEITDLPVGTKYSVEETESGEFKPEIKKLEGEIKSGETEELNFFNKKEDSESLVISKHVQGGSSKTFDFTLTVINSNGDELTEPLCLNSGEEIKSGDHFKLKDGDKAVISGIPFGSSYEVKEIETEDFNIESDHSSGRVDQEEVEVTFNNIPKNPVLNAVNNVIPNTGDWLGQLGVISLAFIILAFLIHLIRVKFFNKGGIKD